MKRYLLALGVASIAALPSAAFAQNGALTGAATGAVGGAVVGGPVGAAVGGVVGAVAGGIADDDRPRFRTYVEERHVRPYKYDGDVVVGTNLPESGIEYYEVPPEYKVKGYRYTVVNNRTVLVDPRTHRVVEVIN
ncbi:MAG: DUF1236 domain-containing protein [Beijerinckiaceae bacterium]|nr:DUF1236 domain-containing protein [Beijerinckiaceae bacterium]